MKRRNLLPILLLLVVPSLVLSQKKENTKLDMAHALTQPTKIQSIVGLLGLDPMRFSMSHSYSLSFSSFGGNAYHQGLYLNTMNYEVSDKLSTYLQVGVRHHPFAGRDSQFNGQNQIFLSGAGLQYQPAENLSVQFEFSQQPDYNPYRYRSSLFQPKTSMENSEEPNQH